MTDWSTLRYVVVDVEGNGHQPPELVELAVVPIVGGVVGEPASWLVKPPHPVRYFATSVHRELGGWQPPEVFDTLRLARRLVPDLPNYKLGTLVERFKLAEGLSSELKPHRATYDALVTARLFVRLAEAADSLEDLRGQPPDKPDEDALF
jgi:exodeoxyribonuclease X